MTNPKLIYKYSNASSCNSMQHATLICSKTCRPMLSETPPRHRSREKGRNGGASDGPHIMKLHDLTLNSCFRLRKSLSNSARFNVAYFP